MNVVIVNSSDTFEYRVDMVYDFFKKRNDKVKVLASDFMHIEKQKRECHKKDYIFLDTIPYKKNISLKRLYSHYNFSNQCKRLLKDMHFDLLYIVIPPNSQARLAKQFKNNKNVKVIMDIIDMWPESLPSNKTDKFPFILWANLRNHNLKYADYIITECDLYQEKLKKYLEGKKVKTIYWAHKNNPDYTEEKNVIKLPENEIHLCYLGSINNIIDIPKIGGIIEELSREKKVILKIIGGGEKEELLITTAKEKGAEVIDYGKIYEYKKKKEIMDTCHYGLNIMKDTVCVGLSMKSIDYWDCGLPIINNLHGDTEKIIDRERCGVNVIGNNWNSKVFSMNMKYDIRSNAVNCYKKYFSSQKFEKNFLQVIDSVGINKGHKHGK